MSGAISAQSALSALSASTAGAAAGKSAADNAAATADRFLKLLVAQMQTQDPLNPMDNAQVTSQMAQINTVSGIGELNATVQALNGRFGQLQALQGTALVGRDVTLQGNRLALAGGTGVGGFELAGTADHVKVEILAPSGQVAATVGLGAQSAGRHAFEWPAGAVPDGAAYTFRVVATAGAAAVAATPLMRDRVDAVSTDAGGQLRLQTRRSGEVAYADVKAFN